MAFTSPPYAASESAWFSMEEDDSAEDRDPWLFPDEATAITASVVSAIQSDPKITTTFDAMRKFVWLERLFRAGLSGRLGPSFSIEKMAVLAEETSEQTLLQRTLRWNVRPNQDELAVLYGLARIAPSLEGTVRARVENCLLKAGLEASVALSDNDEALDRALANALPKIRTLSDDAWERACGISLDLTNSVNAPLIGTLGETGANARIQSLTEKIARTVELRRLRSSLGVHADENLALTQSHCGRL